MQEQGIQQSFLFECFLCKFVWTKYIFHCHLQLWIILVGKISPPKCYQCEHKSRCQTAVEGVTEHLMNESKRRFLWKNETSCTLHVYSKNPSKLTYRLTKKGLIFKSIFGFTNWVLIPIILSSPIFNPLIRGFSYLWVLQIGFSLQVEGARFVDDSGGGSLFVCFNVK